MRVATRRMRAALRLFEDVLPPEASGLNDELKWIAGQLGPVRDLDVQVRRMRDSAAELHLSEALVPYGAWLEAQRQRALAALNTALNSDRFGELLQRLNTIQVWSPIDDRPLADDARRRLRRVHRKLDKRAQKVHRHSPTADLHAVRIRAKRTRYAAEFFEPLFRKPAARLVKRMTQLQDTLGDLQDGVVSGQRIHEAIQTVAGTWPAETSLALGRLLQYDVQRGLRIRRRFGRIYKDVAERGWGRFESKVAIS